MAGMSGRSGEAHFRAADDLAALGLDVRWMANAACAGWPADWWTASGSPATVARAVAICQECPVRGPCADYGRVSASRGVWGGTVIGPGQPRA